MSDEPEDQGSDGGGWLVSYADLMTLLFATFVVLYGTIQQGTSNHILGAIEAIREAFVEVPEKIEIDQEIGDIAKGQFVFKAFRGETLDNPGARQYLIKDDQKIAIDRDKNLVEALLNQMANEKKDSRRLRRSMIVEDNDVGFTIKLLGAYFFPPGGYKFSRQGRQRYLRLTTLLQRIGRPLLIEGHTDNQINRSGISNQELGAMRAGNAAQVLKKHSHITPYMIDTVSYGSTKPITKGKSHEQLSMNRRIEIKVIYK